MYIHYVYDTVHVHVHTIKQHFYAHEIFIKTSLLINFYLLCILALNA